MTPVETIKAIQDLLRQTSPHLVSDGDFGALSHAALEELILAARTPVSAGVEFDSRTEKNLQTLLPIAERAFRPFLRKLIAYMAERGITAKVISGTRTYAEQDDLYAQGRTRSGSIVTNARGGYSNHNFGVAIDIGLFKNGDYLEDSPLYEEAGPIGRAAGLEWGGRWKSIKDYPHYEFPTGLTLAQMRERKANGQQIA